MFRDVRFPVALLLSLLLATFTPAAPVFGQDSHAILNIVIVEGEDAINNFKQRTVREPIVEVQDENHKPVAGAAVLFAMPGNGPGAVFAQGARSATFITDQNGRVVARGLRANHINGKFQMRVTASSQGRTGTATITQTNVGVAAAGALGAGLSVKLLLIIAAVAGGAAGGAYAATHTGGSKTSTIVLGPPTVGAPK